MEFHLPTNLSVEAAASFLALLLLFFTFLRLTNNKNAQRKPPKPSGSWPVIGHLLLLGKLPHISLGNLANKYGPIFMIKLGVHRALVVSSPDMARECLGTNDKVFVNRPRMMFMEHLGYNFAMLGFSPYGQYWREMRKITALELFSNHGLQMSKHLRMSEVRSAIKVIYDDYKEKKRSDAGSEAESTMDMKKWFSDTSLNTSVRLIAGKSLKEFYQGEEYEQCKKAFSDFSKLAGSFVPADVFPFLRWLDIGGYEKSMKKVAKEIDQIAQGWLEMHKRREVTGDEDNEKHDFMDVMLGILSNDLDTASVYDADVVIKATCMAMILGGSNTSAVTLTWALSLLLNHRDALKKVQAELDTQVGKQRLVDESDLKSLVYLQAILKETMRLYPAAPLSLPREAITDCTVDGYDIPAGTRLFVNLYRIHRDPQVWPDPLGFHPERFLEKDFDFKGQNFELTPFGSGRRICPGISLSLQTMQFTLANLLHGFEILTPFGEKVDMTEGVGLTNPKTSPLEVILIPRLPENLYTNLLL